jgi:hypothetical protein
VDFAYYKDTKPAVAIRATLDLLFQDGDSFEVRIPKTKAGTLSGYFNDKGKAALFMARENGRHPGIYVTVNPIEPTIVARSENQLQVSFITTTDAEITRRRWFLMDFDPKRAAGISSTDEELERSKECAEMVVEWLSSIGWPEPIQACSGNGWHLMYRVDLPNDDETRVNFEFATKMLATIFSIPETIVDSSVFNAARIWKVYGTISAKGSSTADRPHRVAHLHRVPEVLVAVTQEQIENVARPLREANSAEFKDMSGEYIGDMVKWLADRGVTVSSGPRPMFGNEGQKWVITRCPFNHEHTDPIVGLVNNRPVYRCLHNSCSAFRWKEFREKIDPNYRDPDTIQKRLKDWCDSDEQELDAELAQSAAALAKRLPGILKELRKESSRTRVSLLEEKLRNERKRYLRETGQSEHNEKGNIVGLIERVRKYQEAGEIPMYWVADYDHRARVGPVGDVNCHKLGDADEIALMVHFHRQGDSWVKQVHTSQAIRFLAEEQRVNPLRRWLKRNEWDKVKRLDTWLIDFMGTRDNVYNRAIGRKWLISAVARAMEPGIQADHMLIFEGKQGVGKSRAARILGGQFYTEFSASLSGINAHRDMTAVIVGKMIVELSELASLRKGDMESLKAMLTTCVDDVRLSYERDARAYPRTCVFIGTTNEMNGQYIQDTTGARRFWFTQVGVAKKVETDLLAAVVDQLWAEAVEAFESGEDWYTVPETETLAEQADRQVMLEDSDPWYAKIRRSLAEADSYGEVFHIRDEFINGQPTGGFIVRAGTIDMILTAILGIEVSRQTAADVARVRRILCAIGFVKVRPSKGWLGSTYAYDLGKQYVPHLWPVVEAAKAAVKFPKPRSKVQSTED